MRKGNQVCRSKNPILRNFCYWASVENFSLQICLKLLNFVKVVSNKHGFTTHIEITLIKKSLILTLMSTCSWNGPEQVKKGDIHWKCIAYFLLDKIAMVCKTQTLIMKLLQCYHTTGSVKCK